MITKSMIIQLHELSINKYGGSKGIRDIGLMESAIARPYQTFGGLDLYPSVFEKAAAMAESIIINHPFVDGNKRTGYLAMLAILENEHTFLNASNDELYNLVIEISTGQIRFDQIVVWLKENCSPA